MEKNNKQLLIRDICARLPYGVYVKIKQYNEPLCLSVKDTLAIYNEGEIINDLQYLYLRPMSSMTEEEKKDILQSLNIHGDIDNEGNLLLGVECNIVTLKVCKKYLGELNKRMFDVCHMIKKGLALEAPEGMYKTE